MSARFYVAPAKLVRGPCHVTGDGFRYLARVLRLDVGDAVILFDGEGHEAPATVARVDVDAASLTLDVGQARPRTPPRPSVTLVCALLKLDKTDWTLQNAT